MCLKEDNSDKKQERENSAGDGFRVPISDECLKAICLFIAKDLTKHKEVKNP